MLGKDVEGSTLCYETLFEANKDGDQGMFAEKFRDQHAQEILEHMEDMEVRYTWSRACTSWSEYFLTAG